MPLPPQPKTPYVIFTTRDTAEGLKTGVRRTYDFFRGANDQLVDMVNPVSIYKGAHEFGVHEANIYIPDPDGHVEDGDAYARKMGHDVLDSFNPLDKKSAYETGKTATNIGTVVVPGIEELNALRGLKVARAAADADVVAARAAAQETYQARLPGAGARKMAAKAQAAGRKLKDRRAAGQRDPSDPLAPRTPASLAKAEADQARMHDKWNKRGSGSGGQGQPALAHASEAPRSNSTAAIGKPDNVMQTAGTGAASSAVPRLKPNGEFEDSALEAKYQKYAHDNPARGRAVRDRLSWKREKERWAASPAARGNDFNKSVNARKIYPYSEVHLRNGKYLDGYRPPRGTKPGEIVSRKAIDFDDYSESDLRTHLSEFNRKYQPGTEITSRKYSELYGEKLSGKKILEVPDTNETSVNRQLFEGVAKKYGIDIRYTPEH